MSAFNGKFIIPLALVALCTACGGGGGKGGGGYGGTSTGYSSVAMSSVASSMAVSSTPISSTAASSITSSITATSSSSSSLAVALPPIERFVTNIGSTFIATGSVNVLVVSGTDFVVQSQDRTGMTLYVFDNDAPGVSACVSTGCVTAWPPLLAKVDDVAVAPLTIITRTDGNKQWALRDKPLYFFVGDAAKGDITGEGVNGIWHVANTESVLLNSDAINSSDGDYLVASGNVPVGITNDNNVSFVSELHNRDGFSLYTFDDDTVGVSNCNAGCLAAWPPLLADANDVAEAPYSIIDRAMGTNPAAKQWAYQGKPLYFFASDTAAGQTLGKALPKWHLARPLPFITKNDATLGSLLTAAGLVKSAVPVSTVETVSNVARHKFTLYTFDNDVAGTSNCTAGCLTNWPALIANESAVAQAPYTIITRASGEKQWALNDMPLYFYAADTQAGDTKGEGVGTKWHVARVAPVVVSNHSTKGNILIAHGNLITATGAADTAHANFTLYTFDSDPIGQTVCTGGCLAAWPALYAPADATAFGDFTIVARDSTTNQWAYKGKPLYFYVGDAAAGDVTGEYTDWTIARP